MLKMQRQKMVERGREKPTHYLKIDWYKWVDEDEADETLDVNTGDMSFSLLNGMGRISGMGGMVGMDMASLMQGMGGTGGMEMSGMCDMGDENDDDDVHERSGESRRGRSCN